ncbi:MAG: hypothetical protein Q8M23_06100 [Bacteroidales bacterium]|nr:hypothetical protein [Bacteroidales bacterium]
MIPTDVFGRIMKKVIGLILFSLLLICSCSAQNYHYKYSYNSGDFINPSLFDELEKDLGYPVNFNTSVDSYSYIQHLKNQNVFIELTDKVRNLYNSGPEDSIYIKSKQLLGFFPTQIPGYYYVLKYYLDRGQYNKALEIIENGIFEYGIEPKRLINLNRLSDIPEFSTEVKALYDRYHESPVNELPDSNLVIIVDSIKYFDQLYRGFSLDSSDPRWIRQVELDSLNAKKFKELVRAKGWLRKYVGQDYIFLHVPVMHWAIYEQLFFLDYIIADCETNNATWAEAEAVIWKIAVHSGRLSKDGVDYHSVPLVYFDSISGNLDIKRSMLGIKSFVAGLSCTRASDPIWLIATSEHQARNHLQNLEKLKKYFVILGFREDQVFIQEATLNKDIENELILKTPIVVKR